MLEVCGNIQFNRKVIIMYWPDFNSLSGSPLNLPLKVKGLTQRYYLCKFQKNPLKSLLKPRRPAGGWMFFLRIISPTTAGYTCAG